jgi:transcriptional regulator with XRE-family HTH domain
MKLAELCGTATNYIGEIEIGRRFPSLKSIEKIGRVLEIEPYRFFIDNAEKKRLNIMTLPALKDGLSSLDRKLSILRGFIPRQLYGGKKFALKDGVLCT